ncbi:EAL domain, c-di-GMP-specific phosphodiesterase class I (or its enzymatically inactive variant) [Meinhardsimonia xiamenensis]|jgi:EAL domain-containing protein (putative c-di-GMP-specific phosphodiesterase class I)|uniref:EAL domain, c-di-GMP-specific phosphodiesterase class I (Or its enzymatically inactive variant) n=1 Tax=Meinhardsimonia xiamenensis TaxID=990712 RepID=A0A1G8YIL9_9RHOB|nr:EAL domain-containing protein [Meinhardsimonia xiamenensis]PRX37307.1 EAL domain-containing protein (putative c-di-GMP-specific phosphodiesterase class I) [Meinhardsimonia xiamenensis]SDK02274.1 EAL domain, c-di-GMP-specific phosphodiesterase class I (or its enzymatically inactive variant) [Meinhardsimonia xiamenensis]
MVDIVTGKLPEGALPALDGPDNPLAAAIAARDRHTIAMVREAVEARRVVLAFQPVVTALQPLRTGFYEGLLRVLEPSGRPIPAREFIGAVEQTELGRKLDCLALEMGLETLRRHAGLRLAINMSARSIGYPPWRAVLEKGLAGEPTIAERLILEITEGSAMLMPDLVQVFMKELQAKDITFALDDFGAGYTSFRYLRDFCFDILKIDGQFIRGIHAEPDNQVLTEALLAIARHFDMFTVAESVECEADAVFLANLGVDCLQGYYFGAPTIRPPWAREEEETRLAAG